MATHSKHSIPLTVIGGYLGAGKTTLLNHLLRHAQGRRLGVIVNDFGSLGIDADLLAAATTESDEGSGDGVISLPNGCVCCTVGAGLHEALQNLADRSPRPDHVVIEVSGVADPSVAAAWGTVPPFEPAGVIVLAAADTIRLQAHDKYVGDEIRRQLAGADLVLLTKGDRCGPAEVDAVEGWITDTAGPTPIVRVVDGDIALEVVLGVRMQDLGDVLDAVDRADTDTPGAVARRASPHDAHVTHDERYRSWSWTGETTVSSAALDHYLASLPPSLLRMKGVVLLDDGSAVDVQVVGRTRTITPHTPSPAAGSATERSALVAIALDDAIAGPVPPPPPPFVVGFREDRSAENSEQT